MAIPPNAKALPRPMDPSDIIDFQIVLSQDGSTGAFLEPGEAVNSFTLALSAEAIAAGLNIKTTGGYSTTLIGNVITFWLEVTAGQQGSTTFDGVGLTLAILLTATTNSTPARTKQRTVTVQVANQ